MPKPKSDRKRVLASVLFEEQNGRCSYCDKPLLNPIEFDLIAYLNSQRSKGGKDAVPESYPTLDHITPRDEGGTWHISNLVAACRRCNNKKSNYKIPEELAQDRPLMVELFRTGKIRNYLRSMNAA